VLGPLGVLGPGALRCCASASLRRSARGAPQDGSCTALNCRSGGSAPSRGVWLRPETASRGSRLCWAAEIHDSTDVWSQEGSGDWHGW